MTRRSPIALLTAALLAIPALAMAHPGRDASPACAAKHAAKIATYDTNQDGKLDRDERHAIHVDRRAEALATHDANKDGKLDQVERQAMKRARVDAMFQQNDTNRDGALTQAEVEASCSRLSRHFDAIDADASGHLTRSEIQAAHEARRFGKRGKHGGRHHHGGHGDQTGK
jgi:Ca2+-binding EF-hand superfamily protein